jgi:pimeloyl-ACP methyl ester carboxylesterase
MSASAQRPRERMARTQPFRTTRSWRTGATALAAVLLASACSVGSPIREGWEVVPGGDLHWEVRGGGAAIVLLHGGGLDLRQWDDEVAWLSRDRLTLRYDQRGHGRSLPSSSPYAAHEDLRELLDRQGIGRAVLVGHSNGGRIAIDFTLAHPDRVAGLFLLAPGVSGWAWDERELAAWLEPIEEAVAVGDRERVLELWLASPFLMPAMERSSVARELRRLARDNVEVWFTDAVELGLDPPAATRLSSILAPTCVLIGERDMPDLERIAEAIAVHAAGTRLVRVEDVGHVLDLEAPREVRAELERFLDELGW